VERLTYGLASASSADEAASYAAELILDALAWEASIRVAIPATSGRLRIVWRTGPDAIDGTRLRSARRLSYERMMYRSVELDDGRTVAVLFPLAWRDRSLGVLEIQAPAAAVLERRATIGAIACQLAGVLAGMAERRDLEREVRVFEDTVGIGREILQARRPQEALNQAATALWRECRQPVAVWWADPETPRSLVSIAGVEPAVAEALAYALSTVRASGDGITSRERGGVVALVAETVGGEARMTVGESERCVVIVASDGPSIARRIEMVTGVLEDSLPLVSASERHEEESSRFDLGLAWTAHELRSPILGVKAALESVATSSDPPAESLLRLSVDELTKLASETEGILGWATGQRDLEVERVDVSALIVDAVAAVRRQHGNDAGVGVDAPRSVIALVDPTHLRAAISNLIRNALSYAGGERVLVSVEGDEETVRILVRDRGPGVSPAERVEIFEPFARGAAGAGREPGSGLGLFIARRVVEAHGGRVWVESDGPGGGATFHVEVPVDGRVLQRPAS
jgi:signal transduction histidine kinase